ncbi:GNAT family N-acetyltransferase [Ferruginibacter lapsinanis]|uniref:GNAT family N-acetyltransferase n=1 Tax=Ferruginibacter lapsinanis TaxID=563172 RepID=UPI001E592669|nr:GNAT family N-acetyltransferase [Ferruginibacter lapsinanis]UEG50198.1 GNAT family N-acetyltransferase [Ferruginibacter lapsinanis]
MQLEWQYKYFDELSVTELYSILKLRNEVFVLEQNCVYQDADDKDQLSFHLMGYANNELAAYCRILPPGLAFPEASIGRVLTSPQYRKAGAGRALMTLAISKTLKQFSVGKIAIGAQLYLKKFYSSLGFVPVGNVYLEDGIEHIEMLLEQPV